MISQVMQTEFSAVLVNLKTPEEALQAIQTQLDVIMKQPQAAGARP